MLVRSLLCIRVHVWEDAGYFGLAPIRDNAVDAHATAEWSDFRHREKSIQSLNVEDLAHNLGNLNHSDSRVYNKVLEVHTLFGGLSRPSLSVSYHDVTRLSRVHLSLETFTHEFPQISVIALLPYDPT